MVYKVLQPILDVGIEGKGPLPSAQHVADQARLKNDSVEAAVEHVVRIHLAMAGTGGFVTGFGGFVTMPIALPVNVAEFYFVATRMTAAIAALRGYDLTQQHIRTAVLLALVGADADDLIRKAGIVSPTGKLIDMAAHQLPGPALMMVNKAVAFRLIGSVGRSTFGRARARAPVRRWRRQRGVRRLPAEADRRPRQGGVPAARRGHRVLRSGGVRTGHTLVTTGSRPVRDGIVAGLRSLAGVREPAGAGSDDRTVGMRAQDIERSVREILGQDRGGRHMARHTSRMGMVTMIARSVRTAVRPGSAGLVERVQALPRMLSAIARGQYRGTTFGHVAMLGAAVVYVVSPLDFMPEALFGVLGLTDDAVVVTWLVAALVNDTEDFIQWERKGGRAEEFAGGRQDAHAAGPQDAPTDEWYRTVQSQVVR